MLGLRVGTSAQGKRNRHMAFGGKRTNNNGTGHEHDIGCEGNPVMGNGRVGNAPQTLHRSRCAATLPKGDLRSERLNIGLSLVGVSLQWVVPSSGGEWRLRSLRLHKRPNHGGGERGQDQPSNRARWVRGLERNCNSASCQFKSPLNWDEGYAFMQKLKI